MITRSQKIWWHLAAPFLRINYKLKMGYKTKKFKIKKGQNFLILMNHTLGPDEMMAGLSFNKTLAFMITDDINNRGLLSKFINHCVCFIPKKKGANDINAVKLLLRAAKDGDSIIMCPEGNRTYSGELCHISKSTVKLIRKMKLPILLYANEGGYGSDPRWGTKRRRGYLVGGVREEIPYSDIEKMNDDELYDRIISGLQIEYDENRLYKSKHRAEGIERVLYVCPKCGSVNTFTSKKEKFWCTKCNASGEYSSNLRIISDDFSFKTIHEWYMWQFEWLKKYDFNHTNLIYFDSSLELCKINNRKKNKLSKNNASIKMYSDKLILEYKEKKETKVLEFKLEDIDDMTALMKKKLSFYVGLDTYILKGECPFNTLKYLFMFYHIRNVVRGEEDEFFGI